MSVQKVISNGYCIGCGNCSLSYEDSETPYEISDEEFTPYVNQNRMSKVRLEDDVCVFSPSFISGGDDNKKVEGTARKREDVIIGSYLDVYAGRVTNKVALKKSSSGGLTTLILEKLFLNGLIDGVIHVKPSGDKDAGLFEYGVSYSIDQITSARKSRYYLVSYYNVIKSLKDKRGSYAFVGVPCQIEALKSFMAKFPQKFEIAFYIGIFCGHQKLPAYTEYLASQVAKKKLGLRDILSVDYRSKENMTRSDRYNFEFVTKSKKKFRQVSSSIFGNDWGLGIYKPKACDFCSNVFGYNADVILGDAWIEPYVSNDAGTNIAIVRKDLIKTILVEALVNGEIHLDKLQARDAFNSQEATYRHRTIGLQQRLKIEKDRGNWVPRVESFIVQRPHILDRLLYKKRYIISEKIRIYYQATKLTSLPFRLSLEVLIFQFTLGSRVFRKLRKFLN